MLSKAGGTDTAPSPGVSSTAVLRPFPRAVLGFTPAGNEELLLLFSLGALLEKGKAWPA